MNARKSVQDKFSSRLSWGDLDRTFLKTLIRSARAEDLAGDGLAGSLRPDHPGDPTTESLLPAQAEVEATVVAREELVACGLPLIEMVLEEYGAGCRVTRLGNDSELCEPGEALAMIIGPAQVVLQAERVLLNFLQRLSGIASNSRRYRNALADSDTRLLDTRKTTPGWRMIEKYAVACGGGWNHRLGLFDRIMIKDNHLVAGQATTGERLSDAVARAKRSRPELAVEVEVDSLEQIPPVIDAGADIILLDNFSDHELRQAVTLIKNRAATEASGGITLERLPLLADTGLHFISVGALVHQSTWKDIALDFQM